MQTHDGRVRSSKPIKIPLHIVSLSIILTTYSVSKKILMQAVNLPESEAVKFDFSALNLWLDKH